MRLTKYFEYVKGNIKKEDMTHLTIKKGSKNDK